MYPADHVALPGGVIEGAIESYGLIMYDESYLLFDVANSELIHERDVVLAIAHETVNMVRSISQPPIRQ